MSDGMLKTVKTLSCKGVRRQGGQLDNWQTQGEHTTTEWTPIRGDHCGS